nr:HAMP domain-containing sensor histidine kinase [uncultured Cellulosilyticum sp.]
MISIRKQLFAIFLSIGCIMVLSTSLIVNVTIQRSFQMYIQNNISYASDMLVDVLEKLYEEDKWQQNLGQKLMLENYMGMGNFSVAVLSPSKEFIWGTTQNELIEQIRQKSQNHIAVRNGLYCFEDRPLHDEDGKLIGYARIGYYPSATLNVNDIKFKNDINMSIVWCCSMILMCFIFAGLYLSRLFTYHIYGISKTSIALADGKLNARYPLKSKIKEIETLRHSMNYLGEKLEKQDTIRKKLISDVSHEIRTPLHILQSNLEAMIDGIYPIDEEQMNMLYKEVVRFGKLLNNLDLLKNIEDNETAKDFKLINLNESIREVFDAFKIVAKEKKINYHIKSSETDNVMIMADKDGMKQLWMNVLSNAFKFTGDRGEIKITTSLKENKECEIVIEDTGIGIDEEDLPYVFERMYRGDKSREQYEGSGIGLTMVKNIVESHKGKVRIESEKDKFTRVIVTLPVNMMMLQPNNISSKMKSYMKLGNKN